MGASLRQGIAALPGDRGVLVILADMPELTADDLSRVLHHAAQAPDLIWRGYSETGKPGHPVYFPRWARDEVLALQGDSGARAVIDAHPDQVRPVPLTANHAITDLDTPADWAAWRAARTT